MHDFICMNHAYACSDAIRNPTCYHCGTDQLATQANALSISNPIRNLPLFSVTHDMTHWWLQFHGTGHSGRSGGAAVRRGGGVGPTRRPRGSSSSPPQNGQAAGWMGQGPGPHPTWPPLMTIEAVVLQMCTVDCICARFPAWEVEITLDKSAGPTQTEQITTVLLSWIWIAYVYLKLVKCSLEPELSHWGHWIWGWRVSRIELYWMGVGPGSIVGIWVGLNLNQILS